MTARTARQCNTCGAVVEDPKGFTQPPGWWLIFGPDGRLDFCRRSCLHEHFFAAQTPAVAAPICQPQP